MRVLLVKPVPPNERFGLGPFFRVEPLGLEYVAQSLLDHGHEVRIADLRFTGGLTRVLRGFRPRLVGVASMHTLDTNAALAAVREIRRADGSIFTLVGGHAAAAYPGPLHQPEVDALCACDGELMVPELVDALERGRSLRGIPGFWLRERGGAEFVPPEPAELLPLERVPRPARHLMAPFQRHYRCVQKMPLWALETARGCPFRCSFCSIWRLHRRSFRMRSIESVCADFQQAGRNIFVVDDLFFYPEARSLELARELRRRGVRKEWLLVQARLDTVARNPELLEAWRPLARCFDIFFGFEAPRQEQLDRLSKDMRASAMDAGVGVARSFGYGVTGNFVIDPDWSESDFEAMWALVDRLHLEGSGYTVLTPLPGTPYFEEVRDRIRERDWSHFDMHHILWEPRLGRRRFFELFVESWRRSILNPANSHGRWRRWLRGLSPRQILALAGALMRTHRQMNLDAYLSETFPLQLPASVGQGPEFMERATPRGP
jgi:radical SAM superfamily enzyme YgiQ (UPF0313 family)